MKKYLYSTALISCLVFANNAMAQDLEAQVKQLQEQLTAQQKLINQLQQKISSNKSDIKE
jgi:peptidoglycan hydrolase CwlO-like protein